MIKRLICKIRGHKTLFQPYKIVVIDGKSIVEIPGTISCERCDERFERGLHQFELMGLVEGRAVLKKYEKDD